MIARIKRIYELPVFDDEVKSIKAKQLNFFIVTATALMIGFVVLNTFTINLINEPNLILSGLIFVFIGLFLLLHRGYVNEVSYILVSITWVSLSYLAWIADGIRDIAYVGQFVVLLLSVVFLGWRATIGFTVLTVALGWGMAYPEIIGEKEATFDLAGSYARDFTFVLLLTTLLIYQVVNTTQQALNRARKSNQELQELSVELEQRVIDRTKALVTSAEISRRLSTILSQEQLLAEVTNLIQSTFNYYHVHIYLQDDETKDLLLAGGTGNAGAMMLANSHRIKMGLGLVGQAAENNEVVLIADVAEVSGWLPNPLLPDTQAEVAVPIALGDEVLGVLDVQENQVNGLGEEDVQLLQSVANQVAVALRNAKLYEQSQRQTTQQRQINEISQKIRNAGDIESVLQIAARELGNVIGVERTSVQINRPHNGRSATVEGKSNAH